MLSALTSLALFIVPLQSPADLAERLASYEQAQGDEARCAALERVAELESTVEGLGAADLATALTKALTDSSPVVRTRCIELLALCKAQDIVLPALVEGSKRTAGELNATHRRQQEILEETFLPSKHLPPKPGDTSPGSRGSPVDRGRRLGMELEQLRDFDRVLQLERATLVRYFAANRDDRSVDGLRILTDATYVGPDLDPTVDALLAFGAAPALEIVGDMLTALERHLAKLDTLLESARKDSPIAAGHIEGRKAAQAWGVSVQARLARFAAERGLPKPPSRATPAKNWTRWLERVAPLLPSSLAASDKSAEER
jgi:hypothetical protein